LHKLKDQDHKVHIALAEHFGHEFGQSQVFGGSQVMVSEISDEVDKEWTVEEDICLYDNRDCAHDVLANHFGVKIGVINHRLMDLSGVDGSARLRMQTVKHGKQQNINMNERETSMATTVNNNTMELDAGMDIVDNNDVEMSQQSDDDENKHLFCPITHELMNDPYSANDGHTYERSAIEEWLKSSNISPATGKPLKSKDIRPNHAMRQVIDKYRKDKLKNKKICADVPSVMELINKSGANGKSLDDLANEFQIKSIEDRKELSNKLDGLMNDFMIYKKDLRYFAL